MRVLYVTQDNKYHMYGGDMTMVRGMRKYLERSGVSVDIVQSSELPSKCQADLVHITFFHLPESVKRIKEWADRSRVPVLISPLFEDQLVLWFEWATQCRGKWHRLRELLGRSLAYKLYATWQKQRIERGNEWRLQRALLSDMWVVVNSQYESNHLKRWLRLRNLQAAVVPLGIDPDVYTAPPADREIAELGDLADFVLEVGRIETRKNQLGLLLALQQSFLPIVLVGSLRHAPELEKPYIAACQELAQLRGNVYFLEQVTQEDMLSLYSRAAVHVLPSWSERPGLVTLEAAACGCKVVCSVPGPITDYLGDLATYCRSDSPSSIRMSIENALTSPAPVALQQTVLARFTWEKTALQMMQVYDSRAK